VRLAITCRKQNEVKKEERKEDNTEIKSLKDALSGLKLGGMGGQQQIGGGTYPTTKAKFIPSDTPVNTQIEGVSVANFAINFLG